MKPKKPNPIPGNKPFPKGVSGNPKGRPKLPDLKAAIAKVLADEKDGVNALDAVLMALRQKAVRGDIRAAEVLMDRGYGKSRQTADINVASTNLEELTDDQLLAIVRGKALD
jgi:hypothetical protein